MTGNAASPQYRENYELRVDVATQTASLVQNGETLKIWPVSTSRFGLGFEPGSFKTPTGRFSVAEKIGVGRRSGRNSKVVNRRDDSQSLEARAMVC